MTDQFEGVVTLGDSCRNSEDEKHGAVHIGDVDLCESVEHYNGRRVAVVVSHPGGPTDLKGAAKVELGWGYSYTPMDSDAFIVDACDVLRLLAKYDGDHVRFSIATVDE